MKPKSALFVCYGNICRSPLAEGIFNHLARAEGLDGSISGESAGTHGFHVGEMPHRLSRKVAQQHGVALESRARQFDVRDFDTFDYIFAMDSNNYDTIVSQAPNRAAVGKVKMMLDYDPQSEAGASVPDPYYGGEDGFEQVFAMLERAGKQILSLLKQGVL